MPCSPEETEAGRLTDLVAVRLNSWSTWRRRRCGGIDNLVWLMMVTIMMMVMIMTMIMMITMRMVMMIIMMVAMVHQSFFTFGLLGQLEPDDNL